MHAAHLDDEKDYVKNVEEDEENEGNVDLNVDIEATDQHFFAQQMALQPEIIRTPNNNTLLSRNNAGQAEPSNFKDLIGGTSSQKKNMIGDGLFLEM